jgi:hypothetical protein
VRRAGTEDEEGILAAEPGQPAEQFQVPGQWQAQENDLQKLRVAAPEAGL